LSAAIDWVKVDYIQEFAEWLYCKEQPLQDAVDLLLWAIEILLNMHFDVPQLEQLKIDGAYAVLKQLLTVCDYQHYSCFCMQVVYSFLQYLNFTLLYYCLFCAFACNWEQSIFQNALTNW
jgi:hypothetical protein